MARIKINREHLNFEGSDSKHSTTTPPSPSEPQSSQDEKNNGHPNILKDEKKEDTKKRSYTEEHDQIVKIEEIATKKQRLSKEIPSSDPSTYAPQDITSTKSITSNSTINNMPTAAPLSASTPRSKASTTEEVKANIIKIEKEARDLKQDKKINEVTPETVPLQNTENQQGQCHYEQRHNSIISNKSKKNQLSSEKSLDSMSISDRNNKSKNDDKGNNAKHLGKGIENDDIAGSIEISKEKIKELQRKRNCLKFQIEYLGCESSDE